MKKHEFYSLVRKNNQVTARQWQGWTDGEYNYYRINGMWCCIVPDCGLSVSYGETRAIARANADLLKEQIERKRNSPEWPGMVERFTKAVMEA